MIQQWFTDAKLGLFIHYGIYAVKSVSESWCFFHDHISYNDYMDQLNGFTAKNFDADQWADIIEQSGAKYAILTTKHHDGVAMYDTQYSDLSVVKKSPAKRDIIKEYTAAMQKKGLKTGLYYSLLDWSHPDYTSVYKGGEVPEDLSQCHKYTEPLDGIQDEERWKNFVQFDRNQIKEILSNYGTIDLIWFDGDWDRTSEQWGLPEFNDYIRNFNPEVVINSRLGEYGDYKTPEQGIPITRPEGPWEFCSTLNKSWSYQEHDTYYKSIKQILRMFTDCISMGGNLLLGIGPKEDGTIPEEQVELLMKVGKWIRENEEAVYGTEEGIMQRYWAGGSTLSKDKKTLYLFVHDTPQESVCLKGLSTKIKRISILHSGKELEHEIHGGVPWFNIPGTTWIKINPEDAHEHITTIKVELEDEIDMYGGSGTVVTHN